MLLTFQDNQPNVWKSEERIIVGFYQNTQQRAHWCTRPWTHHQARSSRSLGRVLTCSGWGPHQMVTCQRHVNRSRQVYRQPVWYGIQFASNITKKMDSPLECTPHDVQRKKWAVLKCIWRGFQCTGRLAIVRHCWSLSDELSQTRASSQWSHFLIHPPVAVSVSSCAQQWTHLLCRVQTRCIQAVCQGMAASTF